MTTAICAFTTATPRRLRNQEKGTGLSSIRRRPAGAERPDYASWQEEHPVGRDQKNITAFCRSPMPVPQINQVLEVILEMADDLLKDAGDADTQSAQHSDSGDGDQKKNQGVFGQSLSLFSDEKSAEKVDNGLHFILPG